jgi:hypothetical protein
MSTKKSPETVRVVVRCRPMSRKEVEDSRVKIVQINDKSGEVSPKLISVRNAPQSLATNQHATASKAVRFNRF